MVDKFSGFVKKRRSNRLYQQWVKMDGLPQEDVPRESPGDKLSDRGYTADDDYYGATRQSSLDSRMVTVPTRYVLTGLGIIALLLIILAVLSTVLITRSC